ncbi:MAG: replication restart helicase PriA [Phycisphaerales bacterium]
MDQTRLFAEDRDSGFDPARDQLVQVVVNRSIDQYPDGLTYAVPDDIGPLAAGDRVVVPLGRSNKATGGYIIEVIAALDSSDIQMGKVKRILERDALAHRLPGGLLDLARWISRYYCTPIGMVLDAMLPGPVKKQTGLVKRTFIDLAPLETHAAENESAPKSRRHSQQQKRILDVLNNLPVDERPMEMRDLLAAADVKSSAAVRRLIERGDVIATTRTQIEAAWLDAAVDRFIPDSLTPMQSQIIAAITTALKSNAGFSTHLLYGVTGSGKTEIYVRLIEHTLKQGRTALMLVPEISLTPQTAGRLLGRFPDSTVAILHSGLTAAQRNQQWSLVADGRARLVLGARSAVFAPIPDGELGLIIVDEEHDSSYKQDQLPRYHGRDVAIRRAQHAQCPIVLGSATPALESWHNAITGKSHLYRLPERVPGTTLPVVDVVDFREEIRARRERSRISLIGPRLEHAIRNTLETGDQVILLLNRRGYANYIACPDQNCGWVMQCDDCDVTMVNHRDPSLPSDGYVRCHHCQTEQKLPRTCPTCGKRIVLFGLGTQRVEIELAARFPQLEEGKTMVRVDSDTMHSAADFHDVLGRFARREIRLLLGTQMIAKGLDFPGVRLVGVISADTALNLPDFRASERTFQLVNQVAGRSGRGQAAGRVIVQSFQPDAPAIQLAAKHDYETFATMELEARTLYRLPPITRMARIVIRHETFATAVEIATKLAVDLRAMAATTSITLRGPMPCPIARIAGKHRQQIELTSPTAGELQQLLTDARNRSLLKADAVMAIDVDPIALL